MNQYRMAMRANDLFEPKGFGDIRALGSKGRVLGLHGTYEAEFAKKQGDVHVYDGGKTLENVLSMLQNDRGRFVIYHTLGLVYTIRKNGLVGKVRVADAVFGEAGHYIAFSNKVTAEIVTRVRDAMVMLQENGTMDEILEKYTTFP